MKDMLSFRDRIRNADTQGINTVPQNGYILEPQEFFRGVEPPIEVSEAYNRLNQGCSSVEDETLIREFRELHCFDLEASKVKKNTAVRVPCVVFDPNIYDILKQDQLYRDICAQEQQLKGSVEQIARPRKESKVGELKQTQRKESIRQVESSGQINKSSRASRSQKPFLRRRQPAEETSRPQAPTSSRIEFKDPPGKDKSLRRISSDDNLRQIQSSIQRDIIHQIANLNSNETSQSVRSINHLSSITSRIRRPSLIMTRSSRKKQSVPTPTSALENEHHRLLEIHAVAAHKLKSVLEDETLWDISIEDQNGVELTGAEKRSEVENLLLIAERKFEEVVDEVTVPYVPSGRAVTECEILDVVEGYLGVCDMLREYKYLEVKDVLVAFKKLKGKATLEDIC